MTKSLVLLPICLLVSPHWASYEVQERPIQSSLVARDALPVADPLAFLVRCIGRYGEQGIQGYTCVLKKQERIAGELQPSEEIDIAFRQNPHAVYMSWIRGQRKANRVVFVEGENNNQMLVNPAGLAGRLLKVALRDVDGADAKASGRYSLREFGMQKGLERVIAAWKKAQAAGTLKAEYQGVHRIREIGDRSCYKLYRVCVTPEDDGVLETTIYIDMETWLHVGTVLKGQDGKLIAEYLFGNVKLNPTFAQGQFTRAAVQ